MQERRNSIANALELHLSCTNPSRYQVIYPTQSIPWLLMICWSTKPEHPRPVDCPSFPGIFWFQLFEKKNNFQGKDKLFFQTMIPNELGQVPHTIECKIPQCTVHKLTSAWECWMIYHIANASYLIVPRWLSDLLFMSISNTNDHHQGGCVGITIAQWRNSARALSQYKDHLSWNMYSHYKDETVIRPSQGWF